MMVEIRIIGEKKEKNRNTMLRGREGGREGEREYQKDKNNKGCVE